MKVSKVSHEKWIFNRWCVIFLITEREMLIESKVKVTHILTVKQHMLIKGKYCQTSLVVFFKKKLKKLKTKEMNLR